MMANQDDLGAIMTAEQGKPLAEAKGEIAYAQVSSNGSARKQSASMATRFRASRPTGASSY
jgi:acyl-CoA reductase-like NAD-dependent aldehyde dehydrogenase